MVGLFKADAASKSSKLTKSLDDTFIASTSSVSRRPMLIGSNAVQIYFTSIFLQNSLSSCVQRN